MPEQLHEFVFDIGFGRRLSEKWVALAWLSPGLASDLDSLGFEDFSLSGVFGAMWRPSETFELMVGARWAVHAKYPLLPAAGFKWKIAPDWELNLMVPQPELIWSPSENLKLSAGGSLAGGTFRTGDDYGKGVGREDLSDEWLSFREIRVFGAGEATLWGGVALRLEAGWMIDREFEFVDEEEDLDVDGAFYASAGLKLSF